MWLVIFIRYTELVKLKAVKDKLTLTLTKEVKVVVNTDRVSLTCFLCQEVVIFHVFYEKSNEIIMILISFLLLQAIEAKQIIDTYLRHLEKVTVPFVINFVFSSVDKIL